MTGSNDVAWEPQPLPEVLTEQLQSHGFAASDGAEVARQIGEAVGPAASASLFVDLGACNFLEGDIDGAIATWRRAVASGQVAPGARALLNLGLLYEHLHLHDRAISVLRSAVERQAEPFATEASIAEARCHCAKGDNSAGLATLARLTENLMVNQPRSGLLGLALLQLGDVARSAGRPDRAERAWRAAANSHLRDVENTANEKLISLLVDLGRDDEARQVIDESTTSRATLTASQRLHRAELLIDLGRSEHAVELLATVQGDRLDISERFRLAQVLLSQGLVNEAIDHLELLTELPLVDHRMRARYALAEVYRVHGMKVEAEEMYQSVIAGEHRYWSPKAGLQLGDLHEQRDDIEGAVGLWVRAASSPVQEVREDAEARLTDRVSSSLALARLEALAQSDDHTASIDSDHGDHGALDAIEWGDDTDDTNDTGDIADGGDTGEAEDRGDDGDDAIAEVDEGADGSEAAAREAPAKITTFADEVQETVDRDDPADSASDADEDSADEESADEDSAAKDSSERDRADEASDGPSDAATDDAPSSDDGAQTADDDAAADAGAADADADEAKFTAVDTDQAAADADAGTETDAKTGDDAATEVNADAKTGADKVEPSNDESGANKSGANKTGAESLAQLRDKVSDAPEVAEQVATSAAGADGSTPDEADDLALGAHWSDDPSRADETEQPTESAESTEAAEVAEPVVVDDSVMHQDVVAPASVVIEPSPAPEPVFVPPVVDAPPTVIPLRVAGLAEDVLPPSTVQVGPVSAPSNEPFIVALGVADEPVDTSRANDPFAELAPADADQIATPSGPTNPYAELSPANLVASNQPLPSPAVPDVPVSRDQLRLGAGENTVYIPGAPAVTSTPRAASASTVDEAAAPHTPLPGQTRLPIDVPGSRPFNDESPRDELRWRSDRSAATDARESGDANSEGETESQGFFSRQVDD